MSISAGEVELVRELRAQTGMGMLECKKVLRQCNGDIVMALDKLRKAAGGPSEPEPEPTE